MLSKSITFIRLLASIFMTKYIYLLVFSLFSSPLFSQINWDDFKSLESIEYDLDFDGKIDKVELFRINGWNDPGDYQKISFNFSNINNYTIEDFEPAYQAYDRSYSHPNEVNSKYIYVIKLQSVLYVFLFGYSYASSPGILTILRIDGNEAQQIFIDEFDLQEIAVKSNGILLIGRRFYEEPYKYIDGYEVRTYAPFTVYILDTEVVIDYDLTEKYNIENYVGFLSLQYGSPHDVIYKNGEKPKLLLTTYRKYPEATVKRLSKDDLVSFSPSELRIMRNEIFADYGYIFKSEDLSSYFTSQKWYKPRYKDVLEKLTEIEKYNIQLIAQEERRNNGG